MKRCNLRTKFVLGFCGVILLVVSALLIYASAEVHKYLEKELDKRGTSIARNLAEASVSPIITEDQIRLQLLLNDCIKDEDDIRYIYVVDYDRHVLAHTFGASFPHALLKVDHPVADSKYGHLAPLEDNEKRSLRDLTVPIQQGDLGRVHVGLTEAVIGAAVRKMLLHVFPYVAVILLIGILAAMLLAATITRPINVLARGVRMVGSGNLVWINEIKTKDEIGELASTFGAMTSELQRRISEQKRAEDELCSKTEMLEREVAERKAAQKALSDKQEQLEMLNHSLEQRIDNSLKEIRKKDQILIQQNRFAAMGEMLGCIGHQWRQPLNNVGLMVQNLHIGLVVGDLTPETMGREIDSIMDGIRFMSRSIDDFRNFFRQDKMKSVFSINSTIATTVEMMRAGLQSRGISIDVNEVEQVDAHGYANEYSQVLLNIISNAQDILEEKSIPEPRIAIRVFHERDRRVVTVRDNGGGIDAGVLPQIFEPYFSTKEQSHGTGIGLYMSKVIIEQNMGGSLVARNVEGGAEFRIEI